MDFDRDGFDRAGREALTGVADVRALPLRELIDSGDQTLSNCLRRLVDEYAHPPANYTAFGNAP